MSLHRRAILFALFASPFAVAAAQAATPEIPDLPDNAPAPRRRHRSGHHDENHHGEGHHSERKHRRNKTHSRRRDRDGDDD